MKVCEIRDEYRRINIGFLFYDEEKETCIVELNETLRLEDAPVFFDVFLRKKLYTVDPVWSKKYMESRVIPPERQNIRSVLKSIGLKEYQTFSLLMSGEGRCPQDDCSIRITGSHPEWVHQRHLHKITTVTTLSGYRLFLTFVDGLTGIVPLGDYIKSHRQWNSYLARPEEFAHISMEMNGLVLAWEGGQRLVYDRLYAMAKETGLDTEDLKRIICDVTTDTSELCQRHSVSRQYVNRTLTKKHIPALKKCGPTNLYFKGEGGFLM